MMTLSALSFARPVWFFALLPIGFLWWRLWRRPEDGRKAWQQVVDAHLLPHLLAAGTAPHQRRRGLLLLAGGLLIAILALAGPALDQASADAGRRDVTQVLVVDLSAQMTAADDAPSRLARVRLKILDLLRALPHGQAALLVYAGEPYLVVPPTTDVETIARFVPELAGDVMPVPGNRPERALAMASRILARSGSKVRDVVWITAGGPPLPEPAGARLSILHAAPADDSGLAAAAAHAGGVYVRMAADDSDIRRLAAALQARGGWRAEAGHGTGEAVDIGCWLLLPLLPLAALAFRRGLLALLVAPLLLSGWLAPRPAEALELPWPPPMLSDYQAWRKLRAGDAEAAAAGFKDPRWGAVAHFRAGHFDQAAGLLEKLEDADSLYNRGNALARQGRLLEALAAYNAALELRPDDADFRHNRDLVQRLLSRDGQNGGRGPAGEKPPAKPKSPANPPPSANSTPGDAEREAARLSEQWLRGVPDEPAGLLRRKLLIEHRRRLSGESASSW